MMVTAASSQSPAVPGPVPRAQLPRHTELHGTSAGRASSARFVEEEAGPQEGEMPCPASLGSFGPALAGRLALTGRSREASVSILALPSLAGRLRAGLACPGSGCSGVMCKLSPPTPSLSCPGL